MSWTNELTQVEITKVKNVEEVREVFELLGFNVIVKDGIIAYGDEGTYYDEDTGVVLSLKPITINSVEKNLVGIISDCVAEPVDLDTMEENFGLKEGEYQVIGINEYLQDQLVTEKDYAVVTNAGFESKCSGGYNPFGYTMFLTKNNIDWVSLQRFIDKKVEELENK